MIELLTLGLHTITYQPEPHKFVNIKPTYVTELRLEEPIKLELKPLEKLNYISVPSAPKTTRQSTAGNTYSYGYCTWHTKNLLPWVPNGLGDAHNWINGLTRTTARPGVVAWEPGHVSVVISVSDDMTTVSEMNYRGWNIVSTRTAPSSHFVYLQ